MIYFIKIGLAILVSTLDRIKPSCNTKAKTENSL